jgi:hypothetical protein
MESSTSILSPNAAATNPHVQLVEQFYNKFHQRDMSLIDLMNDVFEFDGRKHPILPHAEILHTKMAFMNWSKTVYNVQFEHIDIKRLDYDMTDEGIVATLSVTFRNRATDEIGTIPTLHHWTFKDGKAAGLKVTGV